MDQISAADLIKALAAIAGSVVIVFLGWLKLKGTASSAKVGEKSDQHEVSMLDRQMDRIQALEKRNDEMVQIVADAGMWKVKAEMQGQKIDALENEIDTMTEKVVKLEYERHRLSVLVVKLGGDPEQSPEVHKEENNAGNI